MTMNVSDMKMSGGLKFYLVINAIPCLIVLILTCIAAVVFPLA
jgi:hypothetical protein